jgi:hypothetical protein
MSLEWKSVSRIQCPFCYAHSRTFHDDSEETKRAMSSWYRQHILDCGELRESLLNQPDQKDQPDE